MRTSGLVSAMVAALAFGFGPAPPAARGEAEGRAAPKRVLAFYYAWYGTPEVSGHWLHWEGVQADRREIASTTNYPAGGPYDSNDPAAIDRQMRQMAGAGIDGVVVSWWGRGGDDGDVAMPRILEGAARRGLVVSAYYERIAAPDRPEEKAADDLAYLIRRYAGDDGPWLRVRGRPVIFIYSRALGEMGDRRRWRAVRALVKARAGVDPFLVADDNTPEAAAEFDGIHRYATLTSAGSFDRARRRVRAQAAATEAAAAEAGKLGCGTVCPGYDDTSARTPGYVISRHGGRTYDAGWEAIVGGGLDWALITSWNEWHEGTQVEPSAEYGDRALEATRAWAARFKAADARPIPPPVPPSWRPFVAAWRGGTIGLLGDLGATGPDVLASGLPCRLVSLRRLCEGGVTARDCPILVYTGGESARTDFGGGRTLDAALGRFAREGGVLVVAGNEPWPLNTSLDTGEHTWSPKVGLPLALGFDLPPGPGLTFEFRGPLAGLGRHPFPADGDPRFRPCVPPADGRVLAEPLATLIGPDGRPLGDGMIALRHVAGPTRPARVLYAWSRIWDLPGIDRDDLLRRTLAIAASMLPANAGR